MSAGSNSKDVSVRDSEAMDGDFGAHGAFDERSIGPVKPEAQNVAGIQGAKRKQILQACKNRNIAELVSLATSEGGLLQDDLRKAVCKTTIPFSVGSAGLLSVN